MNPLRIVIVSPALADANNGNWQTARRWQRLLQPNQVRIVRPAARPTRFRLGMPGMANAAWG